MDTKRICGTCTECCKTHPVSELKKRVGKWCQFRVQGQGCSIYENRPKGCMQFECQWLKGNVEEPYRPDKTGIVIDYFSVESVGLTIVLWESVQGAFETEYGKMRIANCISDNQPVLQRFLSDKEILLVPHSLRIPPEILKPLVDDKRRVLIVEARDCK